MEKFNADFPLRPKPKALQQHQKFNATLLRCRLNYFVFEPYKKKQDVFIYFSYKMERTRMGISKG